VQGFFNNNNFIVKEIGIVFEKDPCLKNRPLIELPCDFTLLNTKSRALTNAYNILIFLQVCTTVKSF